MLAAHRDGCCRFLHHDEAAAAHIAAVGLQQEGARIAARCKPRAVVEDAPVATVGRVPGHVVSTLRLVVLEVVASDVAVAVGGDAKHHLVRQREQLFLHLREQALGQRHEARDMLLRLASLHGAVVAVEQLGLLNGTALQRVFQHLADLRRGVSHSADVGRVFGLETAFGGTLGQFL